MLDKKPPHTTMRRSIDGFVPQSSGPRRIGFEPVNSKKSAMPKMIPQAPRQPKAMRPSANFPVVGQTLASYSPSASLPLVNPNRAARHAPSPFDLTLEDDKTGSSKTKAKQQSRPRRFFRWKRLTVIFAVLLLLVGGFLGYKFILNSGKAFKGGLFSILSTTKLRGEDVGRVNILVAGNSSDDTGHDGANLTDSIMVLSLDTKNKSAIMMSVPRDLWVEIPGYGHAKINEAYVDGQQGKFNRDGYFPGGMGLLQQVIQNNFGIKLNYYALINYTALRDMVNAVGGIDITVASQDKRGLYDPSIDYATNKPLVKLSNGVHTLNGQQALNLARARGDAYGSYGFPASDFDRTSNQRLELLALKSKIISAGTFANPLKISSLSDAIGNNVKTDLSLGEIRRAYDLGKDVSNIQSIGLNNVDGKNLLANYTSPLGQSALIPAAGLDDFSGIQQLIKQLTSNDPVIREGANVVVLNATTTSGLAGVAAKKLNDKNINVVATDNATTVQATTTIIDASNNKSPATKKLLTSLYGTNVSTKNIYAGIYTADYIIVLGTNQIPTSTTKQSTQ